MRKVLKSLVSLLVIATMLLSMASVSFASNEETPGEIILSTDGIKEVTYVVEYDENGEPLESFTFTGVVVTASAAIVSVEGEFYAGWDEGKVSYNNSLFEFVGMEPLEYFDMFGATHEWTLKAAVDNASAGEVNVGVGIGNEVKADATYPFAAADGSGVGMVNLYFKVKDDVVANGQTATFTPHGSLVYFDHTQSDWENAKDVLGSIKAEHMTLKSTDVTIPEPAPVEYTITYIVDGEEYAKNTYIAGATIVVPEAPAKEGFTFVSWDKFPADGVMPESDVTVEAVFEEIPVAKYTVTYTIDGETVGTQEYEEGATITALEAPEKEGYTFDGWANLPATMPAENITVTGTYTEVVVSETSGSCGANATWALDLETGVLTISGTGAMAEYSSVSNVPWSEYMTKITSLTISDGITTIGKRAFYGATALKEINMSLSVAAVGSYAFQNTSIDTVNATGTKEQLYAMTVNGDLHNVSFLQAVWTVTEPSGNILHAGMNGTGIRWVYDENNAKLDVHKAPNKSTPQKMTSITGGYTAAPWYQYMDEVKEIEFNGVKEILGSTFKSSPTLEKITVGEGTEKIVASAFSYNNNVHTISLPSTLTSIGARSFYFGSDNKLENVLFNMDVDSYENISLGTNNTVFKKSLMDFNNGYRGYHSRSTYWSLNKDTGVLKLINNSTSNTKMDSRGVPGYDPYENYADLITRVEISENIKTLGAAALKDLVNVTSIQFPSALRYINANACRNLTSLKEIVLPDTVVSFGTEAFRGCTSLESVKLSNSLTSIGQGAFRECSTLTEIVIPKSVTTIKQNSFTSSGLKTVYYEGTEEEYNLIYREGNNGVLNRATKVFNYVAE